MRAANTCQIGFSHPSTAVAIRRKIDGLFFLSEMLLRPKIAVIEVTNRLLQQIGKDLGFVMRKMLRMRCSSCGHWNRVPVNKVFIEQNTPEPKVKALIPMYKPLEVSKCEKCGKVIAEPKELIRIVRK